VLRFLIMDNLLRPFRYDKSNDKQRQTTDHKDIRPFQGRKQAPGQRLPSGNPENRVIKKSCGKNPQLRFFASGSWLPSASD
jgi:hypothetical protein